MAEVAMQCSPKCLYFPNMDCSHWVYDEDNPEIKRRKDKKDFVCGYDGHIIANWYSPCPRKIDNTLKELSKKGENNG